MASKKSVPVDPASPTRTRQKKVTTGPTTASVFEAAKRLWNLAETEQRLLELVHNEGPQSCAALAKRMGQPLWTILHALAPQGVLTGAALAETEPCCHLAYPRATDVVHLGRGLETLVENRDCPPAMLPGMQVYSPPEVDAPWAAEFATDRPVQALLELLKEKWAGPKPALIMLSHSGSDIALALVQTFRLKLGRPVFFLDGGALAGWPQSDLAAALRRFRRDADFRGAAVIVQDTESLGAAWRSLAGPKPIGQSAPVALCANGFWAVPRSIEPAAFGCALKVHSHSLRATLGASGQGGAVDSSSGDQAAPDDPDRSREEARRLAAVDAARAMGKPVPVELLKPAAKTAPSPAADVPAPASRSVPVPVPAAVAVPAPAAPAVTARPETATVPIQAGPSPAAAVPRPVNPRLAAALAKAGLPPVGLTEAPPSATQSSRTAANQPSAAQVEASAVPPTVEAPVATQPTHTEATADGEDGPPIPIADEAKFEDIVAGAKNTPNTRQRAELLRRLAGTKSPQVIHLFRSFLASPYDAVRRAAEDGMASLFGSQWNRARPISPPVQPPRGEDGGKGPGGAF